MEEKEYLIPENRIYIEKWKELVLLNRKQGRDFEVLCDFIELCSIYKSDYESIFSKLEERVNNRVIKYIKTYTQI